MYRPFLKNGVKDIFSGLGDENEGKSETENIEESDEESEDSDNSGGNKEFTIESNAVENDSDNLLSDEESAGPKKRKKKSVKSLLFFVSSFFSTQRLYRTTPRICKIYK